jgi:hypothetical protein
MPAMEGEVTKKLWSIGDTVALLDQALSFNPAVIDSRPLVIFAIFCFGLSGLPSIHRVDLL